MRRALSERALALPDNWYYEVHCRLDDARRAARALLAQAERPTAVICGNHVLGYGVLLEVERHDLHAAGHPP